MEALCARLQYRTSACCWDWGSGLCGGAQGVLLHNCCMPVRLHGLSRACV